jgi:hypothetical protein
MTISDFEKFRKAYLDAREKFLRDYDDVVGVGYGLRESEPVIIILVRKQLPIDKAFFREFQPGDFHGFPLVAREPSNCHNDHMMIDWHKVHRVAETMRSLGETSP